jgi:serine/threonine protein kinase
MQPGDRLAGRYDVLQPLGAGGMGEVFKARDTRLDRTVAIKVLPADVADDPDLRARFEREARAIAALDHPHICAIYDIGESETVRFLVMQCLEGDTLAARLSKGPLPLDQVCRYASEIADALDKAHRAGITHRDVKPANIMLTRTGATLLDFGLAKLRGAAAPISMSGMTRLATTALGTAQGTILGTVPYMAPEQVEGKEADARSDIWALGTVIYEMATGARPFCGETPASVIGAILKDEPAPLSALQPLSPPSLDHIVALCLAKDPDERWQSAGDVKRELTWAIAGGRAAPPLVPGATRRFGRLGWLSAATLGLALVVTAPPALRQWMSTTTPPSAIRFEFFPPDNATLAASPATEPSAELAVSPDGTRIAFVAAVAGARPMVWIQSLDALRAKSLPGTEGASGPFWSPDSRFVGFFADKKLKATDLEGGSPREICKAPASNPRGAAWSRDGIIVFAPSTSGGLMQVNDRGGTPTPAIVLGEGDTSYRFPTFLPDGRHLLFFVRGSARPPAMYVGSVGSATMTRLLDTAQNAIYSSGYLLTVRDQTLFAYPFDEQQLTIDPNPLRAAELVGRGSSGLGAFSVSAGGVLAYAHDITPPSQLTWFDRAGHQQGPLTEVGAYLSFRFSSTEQWLTFAKHDPVTATADVWTMDVAHGGAPMRRTSDPDSDVSPIWSPDGTRIVFRSNRAGPNFPFEISLTSGEAERPLSKHEITFPTDWSPDGTFILYHQSSADTGWDEMLLPLSGDLAPIPFAQSTSDDAAGRFSPNGHWIAYASDESGRSEIYVKAFPLSGSREIVSRSGGSEPRWGANGTELFYVDPDAFLTVVRVSATSPVTPQAPPLRLFQIHAPFRGGVFGGNYEVAKDGRVLVNALVGRAPQQITVVVNWTVGLKK